MEQIKYWRKSYLVEAVRITEHNIQEIAEHIGGEFTRATTDVPKILFGNTVGSIGEWCVLVDGHELFYTHERFVREFQTHPEQMANDERYAKVFQLVRAAMLLQDKATYHGESSEGMDLVAIQTTKKILGEL